VLNRSKSDDLTARVENVEGKLDANVGVWEMNQSDLKATHTFGDDKKVTPKTRAFGAKLERNGFDYTFPAHSLTILKLKLQS
jgi:alpha-L-arabinofuranosidase